jgi:hypothetical protein
MSKGGDHANLNQFIDYTIDDQTFLNIFKSTIIGIFSYLNNLIPMFSMDLFFGLLFILVLYLGLTIRNNLKERRLKSITKIIKKQ